MVLSQLKNKNLGILFLLLLVVVFRCLFFLIFGESQFDSDQAVYGLMAKDVATLRSFPSTFYGQKYMLGIESYLAAPFFVLFGASIAALKFPIFLLNTILILSLYFFLQKKLKFTAWESFFISLPLACAPTVPGIHIMAAEGGSVEPFLYLLVLYLLKDRTLAFGLALGFFFSHREFSMLGYIAIGMLEIVDYVLKRTSTSLLKIFKSRIVSLAIAVGIYHVMQWLCSFSPSYFGPPRPAADIQWDRFSENFMWMFKECLPSILGFKSQSLAQFKFIADIPTINSFFTIPLAFLFCYCTFIATKHALQFFVTRPQAIQEERIRFSIYFGSCRCCNTGNVCSFCKGEFHQK